MPWHKKGLIYVPDRTKWWHLNGYAHLPTAEVVDKDRIRIYFAALDEYKYGRIGFVDVDSSNPTKVLYETLEPIFDIGSAGTFDDCGVNPSCIVEISGRKYLYYIGWQRMEKVPYMLFAGVAIQDQDGSFKRFSRAPILERTDQEPFLRSATTIVYEKGILRMWYVSGVDWITVGSTRYPSYVIRTAHSTDGHRWESENHICINFQDDSEFGFGRPWVVKDADHYKMWYSIRSRTAPYRIGYAESKDGLTWTRLDHLVGIAHSESGWDSEMVCYPCVVDVAGKRYMFYNGNRHGESGFGYAEWSDE